MANKKVCNNCHEEQIQASIVPPVPPPGANQPQPEPRKWMNLHVRLSPSYLSAFTLDLCPRCCEEMGLPTNGRMVQLDEREALTEAICEYITVTVQQEVENYHD